MHNDYRWELAITHRGTELDTFIDEYFDNTERNVLLVAGAGFDPRSGLIATQLARSKEATVSALFITEVRSDSDTHLASLAEANSRDLKATIPNHTVMEVTIFDTDNSVIGGRRAAGQLSRIPLAEYTDIVVDISALSVGVSFPMIRYLVDRIHGGSLQGNLHVMVAHQPQIDAMIRAVPTDSAAPVHGFNGGLTLVSGTQDAARLWLPQLAHGRASTLRRIYEGINPDEVCAILPFPASHPRLGDDLLEEVRGTGGFPWQMDARSIVHADEDDPLDLYRTILRL